MKFALLLACVLAGTHGQKTDDNKPIKQLTDYYWGTSDEATPGKAVLLPDQTFTGKIRTALVNDETLTFHSIYNGREVWAASNDAEFYSDAKLTVVTDTAIYIDTVNSPEPTATVTETLLYWGRYNGDRPTWYGAEYMDQYPSQLRVIIDGCLDRTITHNGYRYDSDGLIVKQSDVPGRGLAVIYSATCKSEKAKLIY